MDYDKPRDRMRVGVRYGVKSKSRICRPSRPGIAYGATGGALDTFTFTSHTGSVVTSVEIGEEAFKVGGSSPLAYSLNKKKRWEMIDTLDELVEENVRDRELAEQERARARDAARRMRTGTVSEGEAASISSESAGDENSEEEEPHHSKFHVFNSTRTVVTSKKERIAVAKFHKSRRQYSSKDPAPTEKVVRTRKGDTTVQLKKHREAQTGYLHGEEIASADYLVTINGKPAKHQRHLHADFPDGCKCSYCVPPSVSRAHKYRDAFDV